MFEICFFVSIAYNFCFVPVPVIDESYLGDFHLSRYYTVIPNQKRYYLGRTFEEDFKMNCSGSCFHTANGTLLEDRMWGKTIACPPSLKLGTKLRIDGLGEVVCNDRGGSIKGKRIDVWMGVGDMGLNRIYSKKTSYPGARSVYLVR